MARRGRGPSFSRYVRGNVDEELSAAALASKDVVGAVFDEVTGERMKCSSLVAAWSMENFTPGAGVGPIVVGVAHGDYTDAEIEEYLENSGQWDRGNMVSQEISRRKIRVVGALGGDVDTAAEISRLANGRLIKTKLNWILQEGQTLRIWAFNMGSQPVATTAPSVTAVGHVNLWAV